MDGRRRIDSDECDDANEVVEVTRRLIQVQNLRAHLRASVAEGLARIERGESVELTPELMERIMQRAVDNARAGKPVKDDARP